MDTAHKTDATRAITYGMAGPQHLAQVNELLSANGLPHADVAPHLAGFLLAWPAGMEGETLAGTVGVELHGRLALLRSLCVRPELRGCGIASELCRRITAFARNAGVERFYLLTTTAERFFAARGFTPAERGGVPDAIRATVEFRSACPSSAACMTRELPRGALHLGRELLPLRPDVPGARLWSVGLERVLLTCFEVAPHTRFERHAHEAEQITAVVEGELFFDVEGEIAHVEAGGVIALPPGVPHAVFTRDRGARAFDAWSPPPPEYRAR